VIVADLNTPQDKSEQSEKSKGNAPLVDAPSITAAEEHGAGRAESGFSVEQMVAEFRALRASVIRLWIKGEGGMLRPENIDDLTRFNEAIDQALAESVSRYTQDVSNSKEMFLAMLGHDLRTPLGAIMMSVQFMLDTKELNEPHLTLATRIKSSAGRMQKMIGDLLDFTRSRLGGGIPIVRADMSMEKAVHDVVAEIGASRPDRIIKLDARGGERGEWDCARISQALTNIIGNAVEHGSAGTPVTVVVTHNDDDVAITIHNSGKPISVEHLNGIFGAMKSREAVSGTSGAYGNLGLGLYIAERIVHAHGGRIDVESSEQQGTTFSVHLPRGVSRIAAA
jgi:signal transduction histidine kinase